jgi:hypothetical protein
MLSSFSMSPAIPGILEEGVWVSIVGSRKASDDGLRRASKLASRGIVVVSGLAEGIDTAQLTRRPQDTAGEQ